MSDKKNNLNTFIIVPIIIGLLALAGIQWNTHAQNVNRPVETEIDFPREISNSQVNFNLQPLGNAKFRVVLDNRQNQLTNIKIYDIIGNLILQDKIRPEDGLHKSFDFSHTNSKLFVVEIGNSKYNKTKSIYANPQGRKNDEANLKE